MKNAGLVLWTAGSSSIVSVVCCAWSELNRCLLFSTFWQKSENRPRPALPGFFQGWGPLLLSVVFLCCESKVFFMGVQQMTAGLGTLQEKAKMIKEA